MRLHAITGLPRSGSTLLAQILNQNPIFYASPTSIMPQIVSMLSMTFSGSPEIKSALAKGKEVTEAKIDRCVKSVIEAWYDGKEVVFDKGRGWCHNALILKRLYPEAKMFVTVRDLRNVFATIEKEYGKNPVLDMAANPLEKTVYERANQMFSPQGIIGLPINGVEDLLRRKPDNAVIIQFETFVKSPKLIMEKIYAEIKEPYFEHDFDNVSEVSEDSGLYDAVHLNKFPHTVHKKVEPRDDYEWKKFVSDDVARLIMEKFNGYNRAFGYS